MTIENISIDFPDKTNINVCLDTTDYDAISKAIRNKNYQVFSEFAKLEKLFANPGTFIDIGANIGLMSLYFAAKGWNGYSFEANEHNCRLLTESIRHNNFSKVEVINNAVTDKTGKVGFFGNGPYGFIQDKIHNISYQEINAICLDDWVNQPGIKLNDVELIKIDIEGSELSALRGMKNFLNQIGYPPIYIESNGWCLYAYGETPNTLLNLAADYGYSAWIFNNGRLMPINPSLIQIKCLVDYLLLHSVPLNFKGLLDHETISVDPVEQIEKSFSTMTKLERAYLGYVLKDFPDLIQNVKIIAILNQLKNDSESVISNAVSWYQG